MNSWISKPLDNNDLTVYHLSDTQSFNLLTNANNIILFVYLTNIQIPDIYLSNYKYMGGYKNDIATSLNIELAIYIRKDYLYNNDYFSSPFSKKYFYFDDLPLDEFQSFAYPIYIYRLKLFHTDIYINTSELPPTFVYISGYDDNIILDYLNQYYTITKNKFIDNNIIYVLRLKNLNN